MKTSFSRSQLIVLWSVIILLSIISIVSGLTLRPERYAPFKKIDFEVKFKVWDVRSILVTFAIPTVLLGGMFFLTASNYRPREKLDSRCDSSSSSQDLIK